MNAHAKIHAGVALLWLVPAVAGAAEPLGGLPRFELSGVVIQDEAAWALIAEPHFTQGRTRMVERGSSIGPYRLVTVASDHVILRSPTEEPLRVPFSWRGGSERDRPGGLRETATAPAARTPLAPESPGNTPSAEAPTSEARTSREGGEPGARGPALQSQPSGSNGERRSFRIPPTQSAAIEAYRRERDRMLREEHSVGRE